MAQDPDIKLRAATPHNTPRMSQQAGECLREWHERSWLLVRREAARGQTLEYL
ncbi:MAG: hypothetical protein WAO09_09605 [Candidatus Dormiibacterota bacterium]|jgi:hypothetical protein